MKTTGRYYSSFASNFHPLWRWKSVLANTFNTTGAGSTIASGSARELIPDCSRSQKEAAVFDCTVLHLKKFSMLTAFGSSASGDGGSRDVSGTHMSRSWGI